MSSFAVGDGEGMAALANVQMGCLSSSFVLETEGEEGGGGDGVGLEMLVEQ